MSVATDTVSQGEMIPEAIEEVLIEKVYPMADLRSLLDRLIDSLGMGLKEPSWLYTIVSLAIVLVATSIVWGILKLLFVRTIPRLLQRIPLLSKAGRSTRQIVDKVIMILTVSLFLGLLPLVWAETSVWSRIISVVGKVWITWMIAQLIGYLLDSIRGFMLSSSKYRHSPFVNLFQVFKWIVYFIVCLITVSIVFSVDMTSIGAGLTALSAVLMLVFKDTILGFVASIQLSNDDMVRVGDWVTVPKYGVDGDVIDISLATIKVLNFDKTISTIPPYSMVSETFQNWRPMQESGGRRVKRAIYIDMLSIRYADDALLERVKHSRELRGYVETAVVELATDNLEKGVEDSYSKRRLTNIGLFRRYISENLKRHPRVHKEYTCMVRQLQPTNTGLPLELYFFTDTTAWEEYEDIQSDIFDHLLAVIGVFDLKVFQEVNGNSLSALMQTKPTADEIEA